MNRRDMLIGSVALAVVPGCAQLKILARKVSEIDYKFGMIYAMWDSYRAVYVDTRLIAIKNKAKLSTIPDLWEKLETLDKGLIKADKIIEDIKIGKDILKKEMDQVIQSAKIMADVTKTVLKFLPLIIL